MIRKTANNHEDWAVEGLSNMLLKGNLDIVRNFFFLLVRIIAAQTTVFFRCRFGSRAINLGTVLFGWLLLSLIWGFEGLSRLDFKMTTGHAPEGESSMFLFWLHLAVFAGFALYRIFESSRNLRTRREMRHSEDTGLSILWPLVARFLVPFGLITDGSIKPTWYQLDEFKFQKWIEPLMVISMGFVVSKFGYEAYGTFLKLSGVSIYIMVQIQEMNFYSFIQSQWDAGMAANLMEPTGASGVSSQRSTGMVVTRCLINQNDSSYQQWRQSQTSPFEQNEPVLNGQ